MVIPRIWAFSSKSVCARRGGGMGLSVIVTEEKSILKILTYLGAMERRKIQDWNQPEFKGF